MTDPLKSQPTAIDDDTLRFIGHQLRGIRAATVRFIGEAPAYESQFIEVLMGLGVSAQTLRIRDLAPAPKRRIGIQFKGTSAVITVDPTLPLNG